MDEKEIGLVARYKEHRSLFEVEGVVFKIIEMIPGALHMICYSPCGVYGRARRDRIVIDASDTLASKLGLYGCFTNIHDDDASLYTILGVLKREDENFQVAFKAVQLVTEGSETPSWYKAVACFRISARPRMTLIIP